MNELSQQDSRVLERMVEKVYGPIEAESVDTDGGTKRTDLPDDGGALRAIQASSALVEKHEADGGTVIPVGEHAEALFGDEEKREPLAKIVEDVKREATPPTRDEIAAMLRAEKDARAAACRKEIYDVCVKYDCQLSANPTFDPMVDGGFSVGATPTIVAL